MKTTAKLRRTRRAPLGAPEAEKVRVALLALGEIPVATRAGISRHVALRAAARLPVSAGDATLIRAALDNGALSCRAAS